MSRDAINEVKLNEAKTQLTEELNKAIEEAKEAVKSAAALMPSKEERIKNIVYEIYNLAYITAHYETLHHQAHHMIDDGPVLADYVIKLLEVTK